MAKSTEAIKVNTNPMVEYLENADVNKGFEEFSSANVVFPIIKLVQKTSDSIFELNPDVKVGNFYNTLTNEEYNGEEGLVVSLAYFRKQMVEMKPFAEGGGIVNFLPNNVNVYDYKFDKIRKRYDINGNDLIQSHYHYVVVHAPVQTEAIIIMSLTQLKQSNIWLTVARTAQLMGKRVPMQSVLYKLTSVNVKRPSGTSKSWHIDKVGMCDKDQFERTNKLYDVTSKLQFSNSDANALIDAVKSDSESEDSDISF